MSIENAVRNRALLLESVGKSVLNVRYPKEFEVYFVGLELVDYYGKSLRYFIFPVNPSQMDETQSKITNVKKTLAGVVSLGTPTFIPVDINLTGTFGRKFKILLGTDFTDFISSFKTEDDKVTKASVQDGIINVFDERVKTGYGCLKILEEIVKGADVVDENGPRRLIFYNPAFGNNYVVKPTMFKISQTQESNMIHQYALSLKAIAPLEALQSEADSTYDSIRLNSTGYAQRQIDKTVNDLTSIFTNADNRRNFTGVPGNIF